MAFVIALTFITLLVAFRSIVIPTKAVILNVLSVGAAYGILVLVFQEGFLLEGVLDFDATGIIESWLPLFLFSILFGLSMDYHMFVMGRIKEAHEHGRKHRRGHLDRHQGDRRHDHQRGRDHDRGVADLRLYPQHRAQTVRLRPGRRDLHRRHGDPLGPAPRQHETARPRNWYLPSGCNGCPTSGWRKAPKNLTSQPAGPKAG